MYSALLLILVMAVDFSISEECYKFMTRMQELEKCCTVKDPFPKEALPKCYQSAEGNEGEKIVCAVECNFRESGILGENNELSKEKALEYVATIEEGEWREKTKEIIESCWAKLDAMKELSAQKPSKCPLLYMMMQICLGKKIFLECPAAEWHTTPFCEEAKQSNCLQD
ncbi:uncharacterized protein LOC119769987 isoform X2 [Culex quinquefasciatus]|uniref:uncharacterized protein LOC119769987 isoform X2 n=1 Tax=Culex quinquefasciatus TaxID=7176 RepID=UPI0018E38AB1|nr:uncharacterized protein LOC119769987 isoform X2 [Culex quinquefasciatus]